MWDKKQLQNINTDFCWKVKFANELNSIYFDYFNLTVNAKNDIRDKVHSDSKQV